MESLLAQEAPLTPTHRPTRWARRVCLVRAALLLSHGAHPVLDSAEQDGVEVPVLSRGHLDDCGGGQDP